MRDVLVVAAVVLLALVMVTPAAAVQYGKPDGVGHPYVGLVVFYNSGKVPLWRCTGALISPTVFLTAGHCTGIAPELGYGPSYAQVWFSPGPIAWDPAYTSGSSGVGSYTDYPCAGGYWGTPHPHPGWDGYLTIPNTHDVGVVVLDSEVAMDSYGQLATPFYLDSLATKRGLQNLQFIVVGYGLQCVKPVYSGSRERYVGTVSLVNLRSALTDGYNLHYSSNPGLGDGPGGTCFGDSGGPVLSRTASGQEVIVAVNSFVLNLNCKGAGFGYRVDTSEAQNFIYSFP